MPALPISVADDDAAPDTELPADNRDQRSYLAELVAIGLGAGLDRIGVAPATPFTETLRHLEDRKRRGLAADMQFTYRNPVRSTDPAATLPGARSLIVAALAYAAPFVEPSRHVADADVDTGTGTDSSLAAAHSRSGNGEWTWNVQPSGQKRTCNAAGSQSGSENDATRPRRSAAAGLSAPRARVAWYATADHYAALRAGLDAIAERLRADGYRAVVAADSNSLVDREAARRAGLGWYGKNANLLLPGSGSWFVLGSVITDALLPPSSDVSHDGCGSCTRCLNACPTGALIEPGVVDARRCLAWLLQAPGDFPVEFRESLEDRIYGCDTCQEVCPPNIRTGRATGGAVGRVAETEASAIRRHVSGEPVGTAVELAVKAVHARRAAAPSVVTIDGGRDSRADLEDARKGRFVALSEVFDATDADLSERFGRWYIPRRETRYLRRNALVVLGNAGDPRHPDTDRWLRRYLADADPMLRRHAVWAARRLGRTDLLEGVDGDSDPAIAAELTGPVTARFGQ
ncbi:MAG: hypothetical protein N2037_05685 [Acidimicrobiales bacterium]|nr:hypothetical protein [Acidimicrobiales bacterium]